MVRVGAIESEHSVLGILDRDAADAVPPRTDALAHRRALALLQGYSRSH
jgi:hypothetical protein